MKRSKDAKTKRAGVKAKGRNPVGPPQPPSIVSYAQNLEDVLLWRALNHVEHGTYIDIGAQDPIVDSVSRGFYEQGWRGVHVEPTVQYADLLRKDRPDELVVQAAVSSQSGMIRFFVIPNTGQSTVSHHIAADAARLGYVAVETLVAAITLDDVFDTIGADEVHWLKIDVEGHEADVLKGWIESACRPWIVVVEATTPLTQVESHQAWEGLLLERNYSFVYFDGVNRFYVSEEHADLAKHFRYGPSVWDSYQMPRSSFRVKLLNAGFDEELKGARAAAEGATSELSEARAARAQLTVQLEQAHRVLSETRNALEDTKLSLAQSHAVLDVARGQLTEANEDAKKRRDALELARIQLAQSHSELDRARALADATSGQLAESRADLDKARSALEVAESQLAQSHSELNSTRMELASAQASIGEVENQLSQSRGELDAAGASLHATQSELSQARADLHGMQALVDEIKGQLEKSNAELGKARSTLDSTESQLEQSRRDVGRAVADAQENEARLKSAVDALEVKKAELAQSHGELDKTRAALALTQAQLAQSHGELDKTRSGLHQSDAELARARRDLAELSDMREALRQANDELDQARTAADRAFESWDQTKLELERARDDLDFRRHEMERARADLDRSEAEKRDLMARWAEERKLLESELAALNGGLLRRLSSSFRGTGLSTVRSADSAARQADCGPLSASAPTTSDGRGLIARSANELLYLRDEALVRSAYLTFTGAEPSADALHRCVNRLRAGQSQSRVVVDIAKAVGGSKGLPKLPGLTRLIWQNRLFSVPVIGSLLHRAVNGGEQAQIQRKLSIIETQLELLRHLRPTNPPAIQHDQRAVPPVAQNSSSPNQADAEATAFDEPSAPTNVADSQTRWQDVAWSEPLTWRIEEGLDDGNLPTLIHDEIRRAFAELGHRVVSGSLAEAAAVPVVGALSVSGKASPGRLPIWLGCDWEDSAYPIQSIDVLNESVSAVACASSHSLKVLVDHGVEVPVAVVGLGVDHWDRIEPDNGYKLQAKAFRFLHVSGCGPAKGIDLLLQSFGYVFSSDDNVSLIIKPLGPLPSEARSFLKTLRESNAYYPDVIVIEETLSDAELKSLYMQCHVFVAPSRVEAFGMPIAQALLLGLPVVATAWGGHCDYCDETNAWLLDYSFQPARTEDGSTAAVWAEPWPAVLDDALERAYRADPQQRFAKGWSGRRRLLERFTWKDVALRLASLAKHSQAADASRSARTRIGWLTTWNVHCGIAGHVEHLLEYFPAEDVVIFAGKQEPRIRADNPDNCVRNWTPGKEDNGLGEVARELELRSVKAIVIQHNYSFYNHAELASFIETTIDKGIVTIVELHSTVDPFGDTENWRLSDLRPALHKCHRILVHSPVDVDRLKALGLTRNVMLLPHGVMNKPKDLGAVALNTPPLISSFGFCFPNKGLVELVEAVGLLREQGRPVRLRMLNAQSPHEFSGPVVEKIKQTIARLELQDLVDAHFEFLDDETCLPLLAEADLLVNPYQATGESASGAVRYGLATGRPVAVTPLTIFDDLGDAVFRLPGVSPAQLAEGIADTLAHVAGQTDVAKRVQNAMQRWVDEHDYGRHSKRLLALMHTLGPKRDADVHVVPRPANKIARGAFINTASANCSIFESGRMVYSCIRESSEYTLDYFSLDMIDLPLFATEGRIKRRDQDFLEDAPDYDFWVFNWHFITMAPHVPDDTIRRLPGRKFTVVLELEPGNPLALVPPSLFDGFIALDPAAPRIDSIFAFPRPLEGDPRSHNRSVAKVPVIGSFGFGTPGKGFELLIEAVNREFERAVVRINVPSGTYTSSTDVIHWQEYPKYLATLCRRIAKPGVEVIFTHDFMSPEELVDWCASNDLNCFMYTRRQSGLSATTDQAIMSGRPLLTSSNDTFRHIHKYIPPYPILGLRQAIETTAPLVRKMQRDWSRAAFGETFHSMLANFGILRRSQSPSSAELLNDVPRRRVTVASKRRSYAQDIVWHATRVANALGRSGTYDVRQIVFDEVSELEVQLAEDPASAVVLDAPEIGTAAAVAALRAVTGPKVMLTDNPCGTAGSGVHELIRRPVIPYFTSAAGLRTKWPSIWLVGFSAAQSNIEDVILRIGREAPDSELLLEVPEAEKAGFETRVSKLRHHVRTLEVHRTPFLGEALIANFTVNHLALFYNDPARTEELLSLSSLAMTTERAVAFTRAAPFEPFIEKATYLEDSSIPEIVAMGMDAHIGLYHDFGEWQLYAQLHRLLSDEAWSARDRQSAAA